MKKIYLSPSDQTENPYAWGNTNEGEQCHRIAEALEAALKRCGGVEVKRNALMAISKAIAESNAWGADIHICIHTNAFNKSVMGTRMFYGAAGEIGQKLCGTIMAALSPITPGTSDNITQKTNLNEVTQVSAYTVYIEVGFHDTVEEAKWIVEHTKEIAEAICKGICDGLEIAYVPDGGSQPGEEKQPDGDKLYRVQVGAYRNYANAVRVRDELIKLGYVDAYIRVAE